MSVHSLGWTHLYKSKTMGGIQFHLSMTDQRISPHPHKCFVERPTLHHYTAGIHFLFWFINELVQLAFLEGLDFWSSKRRATSYYQLKQWLLYMSPKWDTISVLGDFSDELNQVCFCAVLETAELNYPRWFSIHSQTQYCFFITILFPKQK